MKANNELLRVLQETASDIAQIEAILDDFPDTGGERGRKLIKVYEIVVRRGRELRALAQTKEK